MSYVVDASVAVKWFVEEPLREQARRLVQGGEPLYAPDLLFAEIANVSWKMVTRGDITRDQGRAITATVEEPFSTILPTSLFHERAFELAMDLGHPVYDCLYLACAEIADAVLVTADARFCDAAASGHHAGRVRHLSAVTA